MDNHQPPPEAETQNASQKPPSQVRLNLVLRPGEQCTLHISTRTPEGQTLETQTLHFSNPPQAWPLPEWLQEPLPEAPRPPAFWQKMRAGLTAPAWKPALIALALVIYLLTRFVGLSNFPIYFFTDEAVQTVLAADFLRDGLRNYDGEFLPTYFPNGGQYNLSLSVYLQVIPYLIFGKSVFLTRATPALISGLAALWSALALRRAFGSRLPWLGALILVVTPAWFLHSRTAFETALATTFYAGFWYYYLGYRNGSSHDLFRAVLLAALTFYSYSPAQMVVAISVLLIGLSDLRYHWQQRRVVVRALGLGALLLLPYLRFQLTYPNETRHHLEILRSYWIMPLPLGEKLRLYVQEYLSGLNPLYWFRPDPPDLIRHVMKGYGHLWRPGLLFSALGLLLALKNLRQPAYRALLIALLAAPSGAALAGLGITRALFMVIPAAWLTALGMEWLIVWISRRLSTWLPEALPYNALAGLAFLGLSLGGFTMLSDALRNGPLWYNQYGLYGMQYGAPQVFGEALDYLKDHPGQPLVITPTWANGTDVLARFFAGDPLPFALGNIDGCLNNYCEDLARTTLVMTPEELQRVQESGKFTDLRIEKTLYYPDGQPGFYFVRLRYVDNIQAIFEAERLERRKPVEETLTLPDGNQAHIAHSRLDMGEIYNIFDNDPTTLIRTAEANPLRLDVTLEKPRTVRSLVVRVGGEPTRVTARLWSPGASQPLEISQEVGETPNPRDVTLSLEAPIPLIRLELEVLSTRDGEPAHVHLWEVQLKE